MEKLMKLPCARVFLDPVDPEREEIPNYPQVIKHPVDLKLILKRLNNNEYSLISNWDKDMNFIWNNAEKFYQKNSYMAILANELHRHYEKEYQRIKILRLAKWSRVLFSFKSRMEALFEAIPPVVGALTQCPERTGQNPLKPFGEEELNVFIRMSLYLQNAGDSKKMTQIIKHFQPEVDIPNEDSEIDVNDLSVQTLYALRDFVGFRLAEMNIAYPK
jgi:hypothetical protein